MKVIDTVEAPIDTKFKVISIVASNAEVDIEAENTEIDIHINEKIEATTITSEIYEIKDGYISKIPSQTTVETLKQNVTTNKEVIIIDKDGNALNDNQILATGMKLKLDENTEFILVVTGDINQDGRISVTDLAKLKMHIIEKEVLVDSKYLAADISGEGQVTITDLAKLKKLIIGME